MPKLVLIANGEPREISMEQELTVGRGYSNLLRLEGDEISRVHAIIYQRNGDFIVRDLDSKNGVLVNGQKISMTELMAGDRLQVGKYCMIFDPPESIAPPHKTELSLPIDAPTPDVANQLPLSRQPFADFERSQLFQAPTPGSNKAAAIEPGIHEEVIFLTRKQVSEHLKSQRGLSEKRHVEIASDAHQTGENYFADARVMDLLLDFVSDEQASSSYGFAESVLRALVMGSKATRGAIVLHQTQPAGLVPLAIFPPEADVAVNRVVLRESFSEGRAVLCPLTRECGLFRDSSTVTRNHVTSLLSVPLQGPDGQSGLLYLDRRGDADSFSMNHLMLAAKIARLLEMVLFSPSRQTTPSPEGAL